MLAILSIGSFVALVVAALALTLLLSTGADRSIVGAISGISAPLLYVVWLNRDGPGEACRVRGHVTECAERWNPGPWLRGLLDPRGPRSRRGAQARHRGLEGLQPEDRSAAVPGE